MSIDLNATPLEVLRHCQERARQEIWSGNAFHSRRWSEAGSAYAMLYGYIQAAEFSQPVTDVEPVATEEPT